MNLVKQNLKSMNENKNKIFGLLAILFVLIGLVGVVGLVSKSQETRKEAFGSPMPQVGYPCPSECKAEYCHLLNMRWNKGDCPSDAPYCCQ